MFSAKRKYGTKKKKIVRSYSKKTIRSESKVEKKITGHAKKSDPFYKAFEEYKPYTVPVETKGLLGGISLTKNPSQEPLRNALRAALAGPYGLSKNYAFILSQGLQLVASGTGFINSVVTCSSVSSSFDFSSFATIFDEFFITKMVVKYEPNNRYNWPVGVGPTTQTTSWPLMVVNLQHAMPGYSSFTSISNNATAKLLNTADPWHFTWHNVERFKDTTVVNPTTSGIAVQGWCQTSSTAAGAYTGSIQMLSPTTGTGMPGGSIVGQIIVQAHCLFRCRY